MTAEKENNLGKILWKIADDLRGAMNADDFRDYMLSFIFLYFLSGNYEAEVKKELASDYPPEDDVKSFKETALKEADGNIADIPNSPIALWYKNNPDDTADFEDQMRRKIHYIIKPEYLWANISELARTQNKDLLDILQKGFKYIEEESFNKSFHGLFSEINLTSDKLGKNYEERNIRLCKIIGRISADMGAFSSDIDTLGDAYEYLIAQFASGSGKKAGEFYTPQGVSDILSRIVTLDAQDPTKERSRLEKVLDFACGSGSLLINIRNKMKGRNIGKIFGQEKNITTYNLARMNMLLHGLRDTEFEIFHGDSLINDWDYLRELNPLARPVFDAVVANPPFSYRWEPDDALKSDVRFKNYGVAPRSAADFAFLLHGFYFLKDDGVMAIILPHGVLFRGAAEESIRKKLVDEKSIDAVIGLPSNLFYSTGIPVCVIVLKKCRKDDDILFINASEHFEKGKRQNKLRASDINKIVDTYIHRKDEARYSRKVDIDEIKSNDYNLNISRYISSAQEEEEIDLLEVNKSLIEVEEKIKQARDKHNAFLRELGLPPLP